MEQGTGSPPEVHPYNIHKAGTSATNHTQRATYPSTFIAQNPGEHELIASAVEDVCAVVCELIRAHQPEIFQHLRVYCDILPLHYRPASYPFPGFVLNLQVATVAHIDNKDHKLCVVLPFGEWTGGQLVLHEVGLVLDLQPGHILIFPSAKITHFNLDFVGIRGSIVFHCDRELEGWFKNRNGWGHHHIAKRPSSETINDLNNSHGGGDNDGPLPSPFK